MKDEALRLAIGKIKSARDCHFAAIDPLLFEAEEILEQALAAPDLQAELEATNRQVEILSDALAESRREVAAPVQPVASLKEADVLMMAEAHGIDPSTNGLYGFYIDCISNQPEVQPAPVQELVERPCHVFNVTKTGALTEWEPTTMAFALTDGKHALYTAAQKPWVGLTDEEKEAIYRQADAENWHDQPLLEAVEVKLRSKNGY